MLRSIAYTSVATRDFTAEDLDALLLDARGFNASVEVTGTLFFHQDKFFQYIEGSDAGIDLVYKRILRSNSHTNMHELLNTTMPRRYFDAWHMGFCKAPKTAIQQLANASWVQSMPITRDEFDGFEGLSLVVYHWNKWSAEGGGSDSVARLLRDQTDIA
ncbi:MAG: BLUF domain-containing protein [Lysobacter sp.]